MSASVPDQAGMTGRTPATGLRIGQGSAVLRALVAAWPFRVLLICSAAGLVSVGLGPDNYWDLRFYHLYAPWAYLHGRYLFDIGPAQYQGFFNPTADLLFYALTSSRLNEAPRVVAFIMGAVHGINAALIFEIALHVLRPLERLDRLTLRAMALLMGVSGAGFVSLLGTTSNDLINSIFVLASLLCILKTAERVGARRAWPGFAWSGLLAGIAVGLKYTAAIFVPGLGLIALLAAVRRQAAGGFVAFAVALPVGIVAVAGHHFLTLWRDFGNPVFPLFNNFFQSPYYESDAIRDKQFLPHDFWQVIANPFYWAQINHHLVSELPFRDWRAGIAYVAVAAGLLTLAASRLGRKHAREDLFAETHGLGIVFVFVIVSFFVWELGFSIYRYAVALEMLTGVVTMGALIWLFKDRRRRIFLAIVLMATAGTTTVYLEWGRRGYDDRYVDVRVPQLPVNSVVLIATWDPAAYFIPFAEPTAQYLGIENNYLELSQDNKLASEVRRLMRTSKRPKFVLSVGEFDSNGLNALLDKFGLRLSAVPCQPIQSNLEVEALSLCPAVAE
jgi:hypothetical protein